MIKWLINWLATKLSPLLQMDEGMLNIYRRLDVLENNSHPPIFSKSQLEKINKRQEKTEKRLEDLETTAFVKKLNKYDWEGSD